MTTHFVPARADRRRFHIVTAEESDPTAAGLLEHILPFVSELPKSLARGADVLDVGCGTGRALVRLAAAFPNSRFQGVDASEPAIESARREARARGLGNVRFEARDPAALDEPNRFDLITTFAIHRQPSPAAVLTGIASALRPDGVFLMQESGGTSAVREGEVRPFATFLYTSLWGWRAAGRLLAEAGFGHVVVQALPHAPLHLFYVARKARSL